MTYMAWNDGPARELGILYHKVEMKHFEELAKRGFEPKEREFEDVNISEETNWGCRCFVSLHKYRFSKVGNHIGRHIHSLT